MAKGIVRNVDELGRIVIPIEVREQFEINSKDGVDFSVQDDSIILRKHVNKCIFCKSDNNLMKYKNKLVCNKCLNNLVKAFLIK